VHYRFFADVFARQNFNPLRLVLDSALYAARSYYDFGESDNRRGELDIYGGVGSWDNLDRQRVGYEAESRNDDCFWAGGKSDGSIPG